MKRVRGTLLTHLTNRIDVAPRSGKGRCHVLPLRPGHARPLDWQKALCGARPRSGWSTDTRGAEPCTSCQEQLDTEAEVAAEPVRRAEEVMRCAQVAAALRDEIRAGTWPPGCLFLTQKEAMARFRASHSTVRRAWEILKAQELIWAEHGGTYVAGGKVKA